MRNNLFTKEEILYTYRKVKRELYNEKEYIVLEDIVEFEENLLENIDYLFDILNGDSDELLNLFLENIDHIGTSNFIFKKVRFTSTGNFKVKKTIENLNRNLFNFDSNENGDSIEFRYISHISIFFQIIGGLWINRIGYKLDNCFPENVYGCRLKKFDDELDLPYYKQNHSLYKPYFNDYRKWQNDLFDKIESFENKDIVVITSDLKKYYHLIEIEYLQKKVETLIEVNIKDLSKKDKFLNDLVFLMLKKFNKANNPDYKDFYDSENINFRYFGLPLTLNVSRVLANIYLIDFDKDILQNVRPIFYGRYVDDMIIAVEYNSEKDNLEFEKVISSLKEFKLDKSGELKNLKGKSFKLSFNSEKENIFLFNNTKDKVELNNIRKSINKSSSEWKFLPDTSEYDENSDLDLFQSINKQCDEVNSLRKSEGLILKRNKFIKEILSFESDIKNYEKTVWQIRLNNFLNITYDFIYDIQNFIDLNKYVPRLFGLIIHSSNDELIKKYFAELNLVFEVLEKNTKKDNSNKFKKAKDFIYWKIYENLICSNCLHKTNSKYALELLSYEIHYNENFEYNVKRYFNTDLHSIPFKNCYFKYEEYVTYISSNLQEEDFEDLTNTFFNENLKNFISSNIQSTKCSCEEGNCDEYCHKIFESTGFYFFTRRITLLELSVAFKNKVIFDPDNFSRLAKQYYHRFYISTERNGDQYECIDFIEAKNHNNPRVCNTHFLTKDESFDARIRQLIEPDKNRFDRLKKIVNNLIRNSNDIDYVVFHELALPRHLYVQIAEKLGFVGINLISGLEYKIDKSKNEADNQLLYVLNTGNKTGGSIALYQSKIIGAIHESAEIFNRANLKISPNFEEKLLINHNNFIFSGLICNDLLDINNRAFLRGNIDALFVIAWNPDLETYQHLVKSATLDIHCYVSLCNNKKYGDTRIRAPYKEEWKRDMQKIHGGELDNFMISELPIYELRDYQTNNIPPSKPFKPFPTGFKISKERERK
ncbi:RNA-directed DNA polymerase [Flavobacterium poyangense]|uniref:RNA-directed DNA polymerase n=1 Tax=Flavobacterium poyangense TaxID=2204302 RepID=UPI001421D422|nr:RNA-directed DNA polymerase [Flavobacterium sp. JXAS1]